MIDGVPIMHLNFHRYFDVEFIINTYKLLRQYMLLPVLVKAMSIYQLYPAEVIACKYVFDVASQHLAEMSAIPNMHLSDARFQESRLKQN